MNAKLGARCHAQQIVLSKGVSHFRSWLDVDDEIKRVEETLRALSKEPSDNDE